jgi:SAM-dependent MidA family methyltransferase
MDPRVATPAPPDPRLLDLLRARADASGFLRFDQFESLSLYAPGLGYYEAKEPRFGPSGDFYTAAHVHALFAQTVAEQVRAEFAASGGRDGFRVVELGPGDGTLARGILAALPVEVAERLQYVLVERSQSLRAQLARAFDGDRTRPSVQFASDLAAPGLFEGIVLANEFLDAQPARRFVRRAGGWQELGARWNGERFVESEAPPAPLPGPVLPEEAPEGAVLEVSPEAEAAVRSIADALLRGRALLLDYGGLEEELLARSPHGTLQAVAAHRPVDDPYASPGRVDLSVHVNFSRLRAAARAAGLQEIAYGPQSEALARWGFEPLWRAALAAAPTSEAEVRTRLSAKNLLFGFGNFRVLEVAAGERAP